MLWYVAMVFLLILFKALKLSPGYLIICDSIGGLFPPLWLIQFHLALINYALGDTKRLKQYLLVPQQSLRAKSPKTTS
jgi:hypothetical protein